MTDESLEGGVPGLTHIVGPVRPSDGGATWTFHTSGANRGGCRRIRASGSSAAALRAGGWMTRCRPVT